MGLRQTQCLPGTAVEMVSHRVELLLAISAQIGALGKVVAQQPIGILVVATLAWAVKITEVHLRPGVRAQLLVSIHLAASVVGQAAP